MSPPNAGVAPQLRQLIYYHLDNDLPENALFLAGRLHGLEPRNADTAHLIALCNLRQGRSKAAYDYSREHGIRGRHLGCAYVFAQASLCLGRHSDGIAALDRARGLWGGRSNWNKHSDCARRQLPDAAAVNCLLGKLWRAQGDMKRATECFVEAVKLNPFMWDAFRELCDNTGAILQPANVFKLTPEMAALFANGTTSSRNIDTSPCPPIQIGSNTLQSLFTPGQDSVNAQSRTAVDPGLNVGGSNLLSRLNGGIPAVNGNSAVWDTPVANGSREEDTLMGEAGPTGQRNTEAPPAPLRKSKAPASFVSDSRIEAPKIGSILTRSKNKASSESSDGPEPSRSIPMLTNHKRTNSGHIQHGTSAHNDANQAPQRKSARLIDRVVRPGSSRIAALPAKDVDSKEKRELKKAKAPSIKSRTGVVGREVSGNREMRSLTDRDTKEARHITIPNTSVNGVYKSSVQSEGAKEQEALQWLLDLFAKLGDGYYHLSRYESQAAIQSFSMVPAQQRDTPWVLAQIARAYYERTSYKEAAEIFSKIRKIAPSRTEDMEIYSTVLWHLKAVTELAFLSHELIEADRLSPQAWCALGNSFSLSREHDQAIKCFKRATQLDPKFAYAWTLQGHEYVANEEFEKAMFCYRSAVSSDNRHYHGWYGLGGCFERLGKYEVAEKHYKCASQINPTNVVLIVCTGVVLEKLKQSSAALIHFSHACELDPRSAFARFKKARALMNLRRPKDALKELEVLKDIAPDDANVHFMLGRIYKMMHDKQSAIKHLTIAMNLDPRAQQYIREHLESLDDDSDDEFDDPE